MENRNKLLTFVFAFIPGVGQMYLGLFKKGIQLLMLFFLAEPVLGFIGLGRFADIIQLVVWCYAFFDTFDIASKLDKGKEVRDTEYFFAKYVNEENGPIKLSSRNFFEDRSFFKLCGWGLILIGIIAILNLTFKTNDFYETIIANIRTYFVPVVLVAAGVYMLLRNKR